jgi:hypothetical protein
MQNGMHARRVVAKRVYIQCMKVSTWNLQVNALKGSLRGVIQELCRVSFMEPGITLYASTWIIFVCFLHYTYSDIHG